MKDKVLYGLIITLVIFLIFGTWSSRNQQKELYKKIEEGNKTIIYADKTTKEDNGQYAKLVNYFNTEKDLNRQLKEDNKKLFKLIKSQDENLLMINKTILSLEGQLTEGFGSVNKKDTNKIDLKLKYPTDGESFITWNGYVNRKNAFYSGKWEFGKLPLQIIMTETNRGLWKSRLVGPEWLLVDSIEINSLPLPVTPKETVFGLVLGGGYYKSLDPNLTNSVVIGGGVRFKDHRVIINATTNKQIGFSYYYDILKLKKK